MKKMKDTLIKVLKDLQKMAEEYANTPSTIDWTQTDILANDHEQIMSDTDKACKNGNKFHLPTDILFNDSGKDYLLTDVCRSKDQLKSETKNKPNKKAIDHEIMR